MKKFWESLRTSFDQWRRRTLPWTGTHIHDFELSIRRRWWPFFYSTSFSSPRYRLIIRNKGDALDRSTVEVRAAPFDDSLASVGGVTQGWRDSSRRDFDNWESEGRQKVKVKLDPNALPKPGTYILGIEIINWVKQKPEDVQKFSDAMDRLRAGTATFDEISNEFQGPEWGGSISIGGGSGEVRRGVKVFDAKVMRYIHVESVGTVLTFWSIIATLLTAIAAILVGIFS